MLHQVRFWKHKQKQKVAQAKQKQHGDVRRNCEMQQHSIWFLEGDLQKGRHFLCRGTNNWDKWNTTHSYAENNTFYSAIVLENLQKSDEDFQSQMHKKLSGKSKKELEYKTSSDIYMEKIDT